MNTYQFRKPHGRKELQELMKQACERVMAEYDAGSAVSLHTHDEVTAIPLAVLGAINDFRYDGWTFGVTYGDYPRKS